MEKVAKVAKVAKEYYCESCNYKCYNKNNFEKHLKTLKHKKCVLEINGNAEVEVEEKKDERIFCKICDRAFKTNSGLWKHNQICKKPLETNNPAISNELILEAFTNMTTQFTDAIKGIAPNIGSSNNTNSNNTNQFNINVFLNEDCKNAINMSDFIKSIEVSLEQLDLTKRQGLEKGITKVIMDNMSKLSIHERPLHCTDTKRDTLYIKDNDKWEKDQDKTKIKEIIHKTQNKNYPALVKWTEENPDFMKHDDKQLYYAKAMSQAGKPLDNVEDKIIKNICKANYVKDDLNTKQQ